eukprot:10902584-Alexandrium_andersonii.AAC.1
MRACVKESGAPVSIIADTTAVDPSETATRGKYVLSLFGPLSENRATFTHTELLRVVVASGDRVLAMGFDEAECDASDKSIVFTLQCDEADGPYVSQDWEGM